MDLEIELDGKVIAIILIAIAAAGVVGYTFLVDRGGVVEVRVVDTLGKGLGGMDVSIISGNENQDGATDASGSVLFESVNPGKTYVNVMDPSGSLVQKEAYSTNLESDKIITALITMEPLMNLKVPGEVTETVQINEVIFIPISITNPGDSAITFTPKLADAPSWVDLLNDSVTIDAGGQGAVYIQVSPPSDSEADSTESFTLTSLEGGFETLIEIGLKEAGRLSLPRTISMTLEKGSGTSGTFRIQNKGDGPVKDLVLNADGETGNWMELTPSEISHISDRRSPQYWEDIEYQVFVPTATEPGTYFGKVLCSYGGTTQSVTVEIEVLAHDVTLDLSPTTLSMKDNEDRYLTVEVTNRGEAVLSNLIINMHPELYKIGTLKEYTIEELGPGETFMTSIDFSYVPHGTYTNLNVWVANPYTDEKLAEEYISLIEVGIR